jgi:hypothetical protein
MANFEISMKILLEKKLNFDKYIILYSLYKKDFNLISTYVDSCGGIDTKYFDELSKEGYLTISAHDGPICYEHLSLTDKGKGVFTNNSDTLFEEFRKFYPKQTPRGRRLHGNLRRCKQLYSKLLEETTHEILCKCAQLYTEEKLRTNSQEYYQGLDVWLNQRNYLTHIEDIDKKEERGSFTDDI